MLVLHISDTIFLNILFYRQGFQCPHPHKAGKRMY